MFIAPLFIIVPNWKQPECLLTAGLISKCWYIHTMEYNSIFKKKNEILVYKQYRGILKMFRLCEIQEWTKVIKIRKWLQR